MAGTLAALPDGRVFQQGDDGLWHHVPNGATFDAMGLSWGDVNYVDELPGDEGDELPDLSGGGGGGGGSGGGGDVTHAGDGTPFTLAGTVSDGAVYIDDADGVWHHIPDSFTFDALGLAWGNINWVDALPGPIGDELPSQAPAPPPPPPPQPPPSPPANSFQWGGLTWGPGDLSKFADWLSDHGASYKTWAAEHPGADAILRSGQPPAPPPPQPTPAPPPPQPVPPASSPPQPANSFQWGGLTWGQGDLQAFKNWLAEHGASYTTWAAEHPAAAALLEGGEPPAPIPPPSSGGSGDDSRGTTGAFDKYADLEHGHQDPVRIILHDTEGGGSPWGVAQGWLDDPRHYGAQLVIDTDGTVLRVVPDDQIAYSTGGNNTGTLAIEMIGFASQSKDEWLANKAQIEAVANQIAGWSVAYGIPLVHSIYAGVSTHADNSAVFPASEGHTDPGPNFPFFYVLDRAKQIVRANGGTPAGSSSPPPDDQIRFTHDELAALWVGGGGDSGDSDVAAAIALAESGGCRYALAGPTDVRPVKTCLFNQTSGEDSHGLWQINLFANKAYASLDLFNPATNAAAAVRIHDAANGFTPWSTYNNGAYRQYLTGTNAPPATSPPASSGGGSGDQGGSSGPGSSEAPAGVQTAWSELIDGVSKGVPSVQSAVGSIVDSLTGVFK